MTSTNDNPEDQVAGLPVFPQYAGEFVVGRLVRRSTEVDDAIIDDGKGARLVYSSSVQPLLEGGDLAYTTPARWRRTPEEWHEIRCAAGDALSIFGDWAITVLVMLLAGLAIGGIGVGALWLIFELVSW